MNLKFRMNLQYFAEESGVEVVPAAEEQAEVKAEVEPQPEIKDEKDFAKALKAREESLRSQLEKEYSERFKDYDTLKDVAEFIKEQTGQDIMTVKEQIEMFRLQQRAQKENLNPETLKRLEELERKAAKLDEYEKERQQAEQYNEWRKQLETFAKEKEVDADALENFMRENNIGTFEAAYKAFKFDEVAKSKEEIEKEAIKKFLEAKKGIPKVEGNGASGQTIPGTPKTLTDARSRALQRLNNWGNMEG